MCIRDRFWGILSIPIQYYLAYLAWYGAFIIFIPVVMFLVLPLRLSLIHISAGWIITNQLVYTVAASRRGHTTRLRQVLNSLGVVLSLIHI